MTHSRAKRWLEMSLNPPPPGYGTALVRHDLQPWDWEVNRTVANHMNGRNLNLNLPPTPSSSSSHHSYQGEWISYSTYRYPLPPSSNLNFGNPQSMFRSNM